MKKVIVLLTCFTPLLIIAQDASISLSTNKGVQWSEGLSWEQILQKAKAENKFIFVDFYATWCRPCHAMDKDVYPTAEVGKVVNDRFIAIKIQMDRTSYDNDQVKSWYYYAKQFGANYS